MRILIADRWTGGFLDEALPPEHLRIAPVFWVRLDRIDDLYFVRSADARMLATYVRQVGVRSTARKVVSRYRERSRNERFVGVGLGLVVGAPDRTGERASDAVFFVAPCHPACMERVVLHRDLVRPAAERVAGGPVVYRPSPVSPGPVVDSGLVGWSPSSGARVEPAAVDRLAAWAAGEVAAPSAGGDRVLSVGTAVREVDPPRPPLQRLPLPLPRLPRPARVPARPTAALFGLGNYAKTQVLPFVAPHLDVVRVHELDPTQLGNRRRRDVCWDTAPGLRDGERVDVLLIAGYHHTHAPLTLDALAAGSVAVVEKPVVTCESDLEQVVKAVDRGGRLFACFQRRHSPINDWARQDLRLRDRTGPLSYSAVVFEEPLPRRHWYRWPISRSRVVSNGCHWIDHFLWLNDFAAVRRTSVFQARGDVVTLAVELVNDSVLSLTLTSAGGSRYGQREYTELRANGRTVRIVDWTRYEAEDNRRVFRRHRLNRQHSYPEMYRSICTRVTGGDPGDPSSALAATAELTLRLDAELERLR
ncbi:Gfo/Idh/MocA family oxidoreductase [Parafrankia discariae]|uniref:Gfo/Idh/MocA family oxidoreductase n=1 Tax=Parafrankia discariae TaxID=365528 RepID=UPI0003AB0572|nr:Gfo/Idh/MocA family oxidoreductase [Parafrankia discariae]